jgi:hypothetical protein
LKKHLRAAKVQKHDERRLRRNAKQNTLMPKAKPKKETTTALNAAFQNAGKVEQRRKKTKPKFHTL